MVPVLNVVASVAIVLLVVLNRAVECVTNSKTTSSPSSNDGVKDLKPDGTSFWSPQPEYYDRDRYSRPDRTDFVTSFGSNENKYGGSTTASYGNKDRFGYGPFSTTGTGSGSAYFTSGGIYDRNKPLHYGSPQPVEYTHDYDNHYDYNSQQGHGYSLGHHPYGSGKDLAKSVLIPLAGAALLGIAAALVANPVLLHLGVAAGKKRKRRDAVMANAHNLAYRAQLRKPPT
ncbi:hypothetical protein quinque_007920 [Culex quinquefasciatus]|uniref:uncharacterized protein LOC6036736 n=1 Tax=Culex quinquefasciatus TaxID=7176 RepID=UPI0018E2DDCC|nr:uncharacterized protein LOC6036736 [Culex quinquefasciatus]